MGGKPDWLFALAELPTRKEKPLFGFEDSRAEWMTVLIDSPLPLTDDMELTRSYGRTPQRVASQVCLGHKGGNDFVS